MLHTIMNINIASASKFVWKTQAVAGFGVSSSRLFCTQNKPHTGNSAFLFNFHKQSVHKYTIPTAYIYLLLISYNKFATNGRTGT